MNKDKVLITGASGSLAQKVKAKLTSDGYEVVSLTSNKNNTSSSTYFWNVSTGVIDIRALENCKHIVHLAGYSILKPWTKSNKKTMYSSRVNAAELLLKTCEENNTPIQTFVSASAMGYYDTHTQDLKTEKDSASPDWIGQLAYDWEKAAMSFNKLKARVVCMRISLLLDKNSGFFQPMLISMRMGIAALFGRSKNILEWIHINDAANFVSFALKNTKVIGAYNLATEEKLSQKQFAKKVKRNYAPYALLLVVPTFILKLILGERSSIISGNLSISVDKLKSSGFEWEFPTVEAAIGKELNRSIEVRA